MIPLQYHKGEHCFWIRFFGAGVGVYDRSKMPPLYSERAGRVKVLRIKKWVVKWLGPRGDYYREKK